MSWCSWFETAWSIDIINIIVTYSNKIRVARSFIEPGVRSLGVLSVNERRQVCREVKIPQQAARREGPYFEKRTSGPAHIRYEKGKGEKGGGRGALDRSRRR